MKKIVIVLFLLFVVLTATANEFERIQAFCIDFNWSGKGWKDFSRPMDYNSAVAQEHLNWYKEHGVNTIQSFCVSHNGYAWYDSEIAPKVPGLKSNFLKELVELGHANDMLDLNTTLPPTLETAGNNRRFIGNANNISAMKEFYLKEY